MDIRILLLCLVTVYGKSPHYSLQRNEFAVYRTNLNTNERESGKEENLNKRPGSSQSFEFETYSEEDPKELQSEGGQQIQNFDSSFLPQNENNQTDLDQYESYSYDYNDQKDLNSKITEKPTFTKYSTRTNDQISKASEEEKKSDWKPMMSAFSNYPKESLESDVQSNWKMQEKKRFQHFNENSKDVEMILPHDKILYLPTVNGRPKPYNGYRLAPEIQQEAENLRESSENREKRLKQGEIVYGKPKIALSPFLNAPKQSFKKYQGEKEIKPYNFSKSFLTDETRNKTSASTIQERAVYPEEQFPSSRESFFRGETETEDDSSSLESYEITSEELAESSPKKIVDKKQSSAENAGNDKFKPTYQDKEAYSFQEDQKFRDFKEDKIIQENKKTLKHYAKDRPTQRESADNSKRDFDNLEKNQEKPQSQEKLPLNVKTMVRPERLLSSRNSNASDTHSRGLFQEQPKFQGGFFYNLKSGLAEGLGRKFKRSAEPFHNSGFFDAEQSHPNYEFFGLNYVTNYGYQGEAPGKKTERAAKYEDEYADVYSGSHNYESPEESYGVPASIYKNMFDSHEEKDEYYDGPFSHEYYDSRETKGFEEDYDPSFYHHSSTSRHYFNNNYQKQETKNEQHTHAPYYEDKFYHSPKFSYNKYDENRFRPKKYFTRESTQESENIEESEKKEEKRNEVAKTPERKINIKNPEPLKFVILGPHKNERNAQEKKEETVNEKKTPRESCQTERRGEMICTVCKNEKTLATHEQCRYSKKTMEKKYFSYKKRNTFKSKDSDQRPERTNIKEKTSSLGNLDPLNKPVQFSSQVSPNESKDNTKWRQLTSKEVRDFFAEVKKRRKRDVSEEFDDFSSENFSMEEPSFGSFEENFFNRPFPSFDKSSESSSEYESDEEAEGSEPEKHFSVNPLDKQRQGVEKNKKAGAQNTKLSGRIQKNEKEAKKIEEEKNNFQFSSAMENYFNTKNQQNSEKVPDEFRNHDWTNCKKINKEKFTCFRCASENGVTSEKCMPKDTTDRAQKRKPHMRDSKLSIRFETNEKTKRDKEEASSRHSTKKPEKFENVENSPANTKVSGNLGNSHNKQSSEAEKLFVTKPVKRRNYQQSKTMENKTTKERSQNKDTRRKSITEDYAN